MARTTTYETQIRIGAKYTGGPEVAKANRDIDRTERNVKGLSATMHKVRKNFFDFGKVAAGAFAGFTAAGILGAAARGMKDLGVAAFKAADEVVRLREGNKRLLMTYGMTSKQAAETEKRLYGVATAMEKGVGHDAEIMSKVLVGMRKSLSTEEIEKNQAAISGYFTAISAGEPTIEKGQQAFEELNNLFMRGKGPALNLMKWDKERIKIFQKLSTDQRKYYGLIRLNQLYGHQTAEFFKTDTGKMNYAMTLFGNLLEDVGDGAVAQKGKIADLLISIANQLSPIAKDVGRIVGAKLAIWLEDVNKNMPETIAHMQKWGTQLGEIMEFLDGIAWWLNKINSLSNSVPVIFDLPKWIKDHWGAGMEAWKPGQIITPSVPPAMDWRYGGSTGAPTTKEEADRQHEEARKTEETRQRGMNYPPYERESKALQEVKRAEVAAAAGGSPTIAGWRAQRVAEIENNPALKKLFAATISQEAGSPEGVQAVVESLFNRAQQRGRTIEQELTGGGSLSNIRTGKSQFYGPIRSGRVQGIVNQGVEDWMMKQADKALAKAKGGSNLIEGRTDQGMRHEIKGPATHFGGQTGDWFGYMEGTKAWSDNFQRKVQEGDKARQQATKLDDVIPLLQEGAGAYPMGEKLSQATRGINAGGRSGGAGGGGTSLAMNSPITINGVPAGREGAVGREVTRALQDPDRLVLAQLRSAKNSEQRLTYDV